MEQANTPPVKQNGGHPLTSADPRMNEQVESLQHPAPLSASDSGAVQSTLAAAYPAESRLVVALVALYVFLLESRVLDLSPIWWMHIPLVLLIALTVITLAKGNFRITFQSQISRVLVLFTAWVAVCVPFSMWRSASMDPLQSQVQALLIYVIVVQAIRTPNAYRKVTGAYAYAILVASLMGFVYGRSVENGRLALAGGTLGDPNELALSLVIGLPFWWDKAHASQGIKKLLCLLCTVPIFISFGKAGSRSGLFTLLMLVAVTFFLASGARKMMIAAGCLILVVASMFVLPDYIRARYITIFSPASNANSSEVHHLESDINSSQERKALLMQSIQMTFQNPIFGVGPGVFSYASFDQRRASSGQGGLAQVTHNTYTQISSETGIPGFLLFLVDMILVLRSAFSSYKRLGDTDPLLGTSGRYLFCLLMAASVGIFFLSVGYSHIVTTLFAFSAALANLQAWQASGAKIAAPKTVTAPSSFSSRFAFAKPAGSAASAAAHGRTPLANSKAIRAAGLKLKRNLAEPSVNKSS